MHNLYLLQKSEDLENGSLYAVVHPQIKSEGQNKSLMKMFTDPWQEDGLPSLTPPPLRLALFE